jgi:hypothetical protein
MVKCAIYINKIVFTSLTPFYFYNCCQKFFLTFYFLNNLLKAVRVKSNTNKVKNKIKEYFRDE